MRSCRPGVFKNHKQLGRPCLLGYIGKCSAPCIGRVTAEEHRAIVDDFCQFMSGQAAPMIKKLEREMRAASDALEYERAARLRDDIGALQRAMERNAVVFRDGTDADVIALAEDPLEVAVQIFHVRGGRVRGERGWVADRFDDGGSEELIEQFLLQLYAEPDPTTNDKDAVPREILVPVMPSSAESLTRMLEERRGSHVSIRVPQRGDKRALMETVARNASEILIKHKTTRAGDLSTRNRALEEIQDALELPTAPLRIECYDISNLQGTEVVGSMVVFEDGLPRKSEYRRFVIRQVEGQNDVAAMHEVITRRFRRLIDDRAAMTKRAADGLPAGAEADEGPLLVDPTTGAPRKFAYAPSLVVVDGGPPQVAAAAKALHELGIDDIALCGLAKRLEEVWLPDVDEPVILPRTSEGLYLLQRLRDEAHRFAITHHRARRSKSMVESLLDQVPGLGEVRRKALISYFGSLEEAARGNGRGDCRRARFRSQDGTRHQGRHCSRLRNQRRSTWPPARCLTASRLLPALRSGNNQPCDQRKSRGRAGGRPSRDQQAPRASSTPRARPSRSAWSSSAACRARALHGGHSLEDLGWYVVDNLPPSVFPEVCRQARRST